MDSRAFAIALLVIAASGCGGAERPASGGVAYLIGYSTDPYGSSRPEGFGVATDLAGGQVRRAEEDAPKSLSEIVWLGGDLLAVRNGAAGGPPAALFALRDGGLQRLDDPPLRPMERIFAWSPDGKVLATQPWVSTGCGEGARPELRCVKSGRYVYAQRSDGSNRHLAARGILRGWTPDGRLLVFRGLNTDVASGSYVSLDLGGGRSVTVLSSRQVSAFADRRAELGALAYSADGRYVAARVLLVGGDVGLWGVVVARADGHIVRLIRSHDLISMFAWSPRRNELAYTTSGLPAPHELYVVSSPHAKPRRIMSQVEHFDWFSWSPEGRRLLVDNEHRHAWWLLRLTGQGPVRVLGGVAVPVRRLPRLGGMPLWCCPAQTYGGS